jgi:hypothetical protein
MDCVDCHNRPSHQVTPPDESVDASVARGAIDPSLPYIKQQGVAALTANYASRDEALAGIDRSIREYYQKTYPQLVPSHEVAISAATASLQGIYDQTFFPDMNVRWNTYPTRDGHLNFMGCDRCHDGQHRSASGRVITADCSTCHRILRQGTPASLKVATGAGGLAFEHPVDIGDAWKEAPCSACHTGGSM